eukprot:2922662-Pleurochrysis_carterae.AAC.2
MPFIGRGVARSHGRTRSRYARGERAGRELRWSGGGRGWGARALACVRVRACVCVRARVSKCASRAALGGEKEEDGDGGDDWVGRERFSDEGRDRVGAYSRLR